MYKVPTDLPILKVNNFVIPCLLLMINQILSLTKRMI